MVYCGIYKFTEKETGKVYIGQSKNIWHRYGFHYSQAFSQPYDKISPFDQALCNNPTGFEFEIIEECPEEELTKRELYWIEYYNSVAQGYNTILNRKIYQFSLNGELINIYYGYAEAANAIGKEQGSGNIYKCCQGDIKTAYGYVWSLSPDFNNRLSVSTKNASKSHSTKRREVLQLDSKGNVINKYPSCAEAARALGVTGAAITHVCNGRAKTCKGFVWKYNEEKWEM